MLYNNEWITEEIIEEIKKYLETNENENMMIQNLWDAANTVLRGKFIAIKSYLRKQGKSQINNLTSHLKQLQKEEQTKPKVSRKKKIKDKRKKQMKERQRKQWKRSMKVKAGSLKKISKIDKPLARLIKKKRKRAQINKIGNDKKREIKTDTT